MTPGAVLPTIDSLKSDLLEIVRLGQITRPEGVHLSWVGSEFNKRKGATFETFLSYLAIQNATVDIPHTQRKLGEFLRGQCADIVDIELPSNGSMIIREKLRYPTTAPVRSSDAAMVTGGSGSNTPRFRKGVWSAFIRQVEVGRFRNLNLRTGNFIDSEAVVQGEEWKEIDRAYIIGYAPDEPIDANLVQQKIEQWATAVGVDTHQIIAGEAVSDAKKPSLTDLARIIETLPANVASSWMIPAEVLRHLRRG